MIKNCTIDVVISIYAYHADKQLSTLWPGEPWIRRILLLGDQQVVSNDTEPLHCYGLTHYLASIYRHYHVLLKQYYWMNGLHKNPAIPGMEYLKYISLLHHQHDRKCCEIEYNIWKMQIGILLGSNVSTRLMITREVNCNFMFTFTILAFISECYMAD